VNKKLSLMAVCGVFLCVSPFAAYAQNTLKGMSLNGATGLYSIPTARIGWERSADVGLDLGTSYNFTEENPIAKIGLSLFKWVEISAAVDFQPRFFDRNNTDGIIGAKLQFPTAKTALGLGGNIQFLNDRYGSSNTAGQLYFAASYSGEFFSWPAETTFVLGYTFLKGNKDNIDFGMGFDMVVLPDIFQRFVHLVLDFSNFSYSVDALGANAWARGCLNTGLRIDIASIPALSKLKLAVDLAILDVLDADRSLVIGLVFGLPLK
jgi:hypothetical protein